MLTDPTTVGSVRGHVHRRGRGWGYVVDVGFDPATGQPPSADEVGVRHQARRPGSGPAGARGAARRVLRRAVTRDGRGVPRGLARARQAEPAADDVGRVPKVDPPPRPWTRHHRAPTAPAGAPGGVLRRAREARWGEGPGPVGEDDRQRALGASPGARRRRAPRSRLSATSPGLPGRRGSSASRCRPGPLHELGRFLAAVDGDRLYAAYVVLATTGMRRGEVLGLRWADLDLDAGHLSVKQTITASNHQLVIIGPTKTARSRRRIELDPVTVEALRRHRKEQAAERLSPVRHEWLSDDLVFCELDGTPLHPDGFSSTFSKRQSQGRRPADCAAPTTSATPGPPLR